MQNISIVAQSRNKYSPPWVEFVELPLAVITAACFLLYSMSLSAFFPDIFAHSSWQNYLNSDWMETLGELQFPSLDTDSQSD